MVVIDPHNRVKRKCEEMSHSWVDLKRMKRGGLELPKIVQYPNVVLAQRDICVVMVGSLRNRYLAAIRYV
jgi:hypothetical protein